MSPCTRGKEITVWDYLLAQQGSSIQRFNFHSLLAALTAFSAIVEGIVSIPARTIRVVEAFLLSCQNI